MLMIFVIENCLDHLLVSEQVISNDKSIATLHAISLSKIAYKFRNVFLPNICMSVSIV